MSRRPSPLDNEQCRQCSSFSDYMKSTKKKINDEDGAQGRSPVRKYLCEKNHNQLCTKYFSRKVEM